MLTMRFRAKIQALTRRQSNLYATGKKMASRHLVRAKTDGHIFSRPNKHRAINTAVQILIDRSQSMEEDKRIKIALQTGLAAGIALQSIPGTSCAAAAFGAMGGEITPLTFHGESFRETASFYDKVLPVTDTPMGEALLWGYAQLVRRREARKILLVITDGEPYTVKCVTGDQWAEYQSATRSVAKRIESSDTELYAIGIDTPVTGMFANAVNIQKVSDLPQLVFELIGNRIAA